MQTSRETWVQDGNLRKLADYTLGVAIVVTHFVIMAAHEWRLEKPLLPSRPLPPRQPN